MTADAEQCEWCQGPADPTSTCPWSLECPTCGVQPGRRCKRPSGHSGRFVPMHAARYQAAEQLDDANAVPWTYDAEKRERAGLHGVAGQLRLDAGEL